MARDPRKLRVFAVADALVIDVYRVTAAFPSEHRYELCSQLRRAAISTAANIVEGCARRTSREYVHSLNIATGSAAEAEYLLDVAFRLGLVPTETHALMGSRYHRATEGSPEASEYPRWPALNRH
jgi:four helix bundle protein